MIDLRVIREEAKKVAKLATREIVYNDRDVFVYDLGNGREFRCDWTTKDFYVSFEVDDVVFASETIPNAVFDRYDAFYEVIERVFENGYIADDIRYF